MNVMVVDDSSVMRRIHQKSLEAMGWHVTTAEDGVDALAKLAAAPACQLLLTDLHMPNMDGIELSAEVRKKPNYAKMKILMVTSDGAMEAVQKALAAGVDDFLIKPFTPDTFTAKVKSVAGE